MPRYKKRPSGVQQYILVASIITFSCLREAYANSQHQTNALKVEGRRQHLQHRSSDIALPRFHKSQHNRHLTTSSSVAKVRVGYPENAYKRQPYGLSMSEGTKIATFNSGNMVWDYGAQRLLDSALSELVPLATYDPAQGPVRAVIMPTANMLVPAMMYPNLEGVYLRFQGAMQQFNAPVFLVGVGLHLEFSGGFSLGTVRAKEKPNFNASGYVLDPRQGLFFHQIKEAGGVIAVRGRYTEAVCLVNQLPPPIVLGCPSLFINHNPELGATLMMKWNRVLQQRDFRNLRLAVGLPHVPHLPSAGQRYLDSNVLLKFIANNIFRVFPKSFAVLQTPYDAEHTLRRLQEYGVALGPDRVKYFYDAAHWIEDMRQSADFLFSFRIHGTMAGLAAQVPGIVIATDYRILELAQQMAVPTVALQDPIFDMRPFGLFKFMSRVGFNSSFLDERRRQLAGEYVRIFDHLGLPLNPGIKVLAQ